MEAVGLQAVDQILSCSTYDGDEEATMSSEVTHIVAEAEHAVHAAVGVATGLASAAGTQLFVFVFVFGSRAVAVAEVSLLLGVCPGADGAAATAPAGRGRAG